MTTYLFGCYREVILLIAAFTMTSSIQCPPGLRDSWNHDLSLVLGTMLT